MQRPGRRRRDGDDAADNDTAEGARLDELLSDVIEATATQVAVMGPEGAVVTANSAFRLAFASGGDPTGRRLDELGGLTTPQARADLVSAVHGALEVRGEVAMFVHDGAAIIRRWWEVSVAPLTAGAVLRLRDVTELVEAARAGSSSRGRDPETGLLGPEAVEPHLQAVLDRTADRLACVAAFRIDQLGLVTSALGDVGAGEMVQQVATTVRHCLPPRSDLGRTGDSFIAMFDAADDLEVDRVVSAIGDAVRQPVTTRGRTMRVTASIGFVTVDPARREELMPSDLIARADAALREATARGGNRVVAFGAHTDAAAVSTVRLWNELRNAIQYRQMEVWFQPIVNLTTRHPVAAEALSRWHHPQLGDVSPDEFIPSAERNAEILNIGAFVHDRSTQVSRALRTDTTTRLPNFHLCINVAVEELAWPHFASSLLTRIASNDARPDWFSLEVPERSLDLGDRAVRDNLAALASAGIVLTLDGFGRSVPLLPQLIDLGIRRVKFDRALIAQLLVDRRVERVITSLVQLAVALGLDTIATGVETEEQALLLAHLGCRSGQGFLFSPAVPETDLSRVLRDLSTR